MSERERESEKRKRERERVHTRARAHTRAHVGEKKRPFDNTPELAPKEGVLFIGCHCDIIRLLNERKPSTPFHKGGVLSLEQRGLISHAAHPLRAHRNRQIHLVVPVYISS